MKLMLVVIEVWSIAYHEKQRRSVIVRKTRKRIHHIYIDSSDYVLFVWNNEKTQKKMSFVFLSSFFCYYLVIT